MRETRRGSSVCIVYSSCTVDMHCIGYEEQKTCVMQRCTASEDTPSDGYINKVFDKLVSSLASFG